MSWLRFSRAWASTRSKSAFSWSSLFMISTTAVLVFLRVAPDDLGADLDAFDGLQEEQRGVGHAQGGLHVAGEVGVPRRIEDVDLVALPFAVEQGAADGDPAFDLIGAVVGDGVPFFDPAEARRSAGGEQKCFGGHRFAGPAMADEAHVANVIGCVFLHGVS